MRDPKSCRSNEGLTEGLRWRFDEDDFSPDLSSSTEMVAWVLSVDAIAGLRHCRKLDPHDGKSVYRISQFIFQVAQLVTLPQSVEQRLKSVGIEELSATSAVKEMSCLFHGRIPQVVAIWALELANSNHDRVLQRTAKFDSLLRKYIDFYVLLLTLTEDFARMQELIGDVIASKKRGAVIDWMTDKVLLGLLEIVHNISEEVSYLERLHILYTALETMKSRRSLPSFLCLQKAMCIYLSEYLGKDVNSNQLVYSYCTNMWGPPRKHRQGDQPASHDDEELSSATKDAILNPDEGPIFDDPKQMLP